MGDARVGLIARAGDTGLGHMTWEFARHIDPAQVLVVDMADHQPDSVLHLERFARPLRARWDRQGYFDDDLVKYWLDGIDVLYTAETPYDWRIFDWCRERGIATILHAMPELLDHDMLELSPPTHLWLPTTWRMREVAASISPEISTAMVPVPVATDRWPDAGRARRSGPLRVLHVAASAMADRAGTLPFMKALTMVSEQVDVTIVAQAGLPAPLRQVPGNVDVVVASSIDHYWDLYGDHDVLVQPRRYGGLSLSAQEAAGAGLGLVMTGCSPNAEFYPCTPMDCRGGIIHAMKGGEIQGFDVLPKTIARHIDELAASPELTRIVRDRALSWSVRSSWDVLGPMYRDLLNGAHAAVERL